MKQFFALFFLFVGSIAGYVAGFAHTITIIAAVYYGNVFQAFITACLPVVSEVYWIVKLWDINQLYCWYIIISAIIFALNILNVHFITKALEGEG